MKKISIDNVKFLHSLVSKYSGGGVGLRDEGLLGSAVEGVYQTFGGKELYASMEEKAAHLGFALISNHAFLDGNKRIGMLAMLTFLEINGIRLKLSNQDIIDAGMGVASGKMGYEELFGWIKRLEI